MAIVRKSKAELKSVAKAVAKSVTKSVAKAVIKGSNVKGMKYGTNDSNDDSQSFDSRGTDRGALGLTLRIGESVVIGQEITVAVTRIKEGKDGGIASVGLAIVAPRSIDISRVGMRVYNNTRSWRKDDGNE